MVKESENVSSEWNVPADAYSPEWWRVTLSSIGDAVIVTDETGNVAFMNPVAQQLTGWEIADAANRPLEEIFSIVNDDNRERVSNPVTEVLKSGSIAGLGNHTVLISKNGRECPIDDSAAPIRDHAGNVRGVVLVFRDITERKEAERSSRRLVALVASSDDAIISKTLKGEIVSWNSGAEAIFGYKAEEIIGRNIQLIIPADKLEEEHQILARIGEGEPIDHFETTRKTKAGATNDVSVTISPIFDSNNRVVGVSTIAHDITDRKRAESASMYLASIVESSQDAIIGKSLNSVIVSWNRAAEQMFGYTAEEAIGQRINLIIPADRQSEEDHIIRTIASGKRVEHFETVRVAKDGTQLDLSLTISPIKNSQGRVVGASKIARDIGDRKRLEQEREELLDRVQAARAKLEEANRLKDEFLATVSHELRTPLNAIVGWATLLSDGKIDKATSERAVETIKRNALSQSQIINDILDVSRIVSGRLRLNISTIDLVTIIEMAIETVRPAAEGKGISLETIIEHPVSPISGDPDRLQQIVWNLLSNAIKFTPAGGHISAECAALDDTVTLSISDTGPGLPKDKLEAIFGRFVQLKEGLADRESGVGLGLAISRDLARAMNGDLTVKSNEGNGARFTLSLPRASAHQKR